jgi:hypothetical protein
VAGATGATGLGAYNPNDIFFPTFLNPLTFDNVCI